MIQNMEIFKNLRLKNRQSQKYLASILGVTDTYISRIERNKNQYSVPQIQLLMKHFNINLIKINFGKLEIINNYYAKLLREDFNTEGYFKGNNLNDLVSLIEKYKNLNNKESFSNLINASLNSVSAWERYDRTISLCTFESISSKCGFVDIYIAQDGVFLKKPYMDTKLEDSELYKLAKISCKYLDKTRTYSNILGKINVENENVNYRPYQVYYAKTELESALKMIDTCPEAYLDELIGLNHLPKDSTIDDVYYEFYKNAKLCEIIDANFSASYNYKYEGEGLYIRFGDGGYQSCKLSTLLEDVYNEDFYKMNIDEAFDNDESTNSELVNRLYYDLVRSVY